MNWNTAGFNNDQNCMMNSRTINDNNMYSKSGKTSNLINKFGGVWLPVPTLLGIVSTIFWTWLILRTVGYQEKRLEKAIEPIIEQF